MSDIVILDHLKLYLQDLIDGGIHKIPFNDLMWDEKTIDCINAIDDIIEENERLNNRINKAIAYLEAGKTFPNEDCRETVEYMQNILLDILKGDI